MNLKTTSEYEISLASSICMAYRYVGEIVLLQQWLSAVAGVGCLGRFCSLALLLAMICLGPLSFWLAPGGSSNGGDNGKTTRARLFPSLREPIISS